tara:strand:+ start:9887 stop:10162 length:276 start_codon:yes stop_codon:yes gene_type:complete
MVKIMEETNYLTSAKKYYKRPTQKGDISMDRTKSVWEATYQAGSTKLEELVEKGIKRGAGTSDVVHTPANDDQLLPFKAQLDEECLNFVVS